MQWYKNLLTRSQGRDATQPNRLLVALSTGTIATYSLTLRPTPTLTHTFDTQLFHDSTLVLSLAVASFTANVLATLSSGAVAIVERNKLGNQWKAHDLEVWCGAWKSSETLLTGGDDSKLKLWDLREKVETPSLQASWFVTVGDS
jgi:WD40 repeat protein